MRVQQLEQMYKEGIHRFKEQLRKQEKERLEIAKVQIRQEQKLIYEQKMQDVKKAHNRELRLVQEELNRIMEQAVSLRTQIADIISEKEE